MFVTNYHAQMCIVLVTCNHYSFVIIFKESYFLIIQVVHVVYKQQQQQ